MNCCICEKKFEKKNKTNTCSLKCSYVKRGMDKSLNLLGKKYGELIPKKRMPSVNSKVVWLCDCSCGNETSVTVGQLTRTDGKQTKSCGCLLNRKRADSPIWCGGKTVSRSYFSQIKKGAGKRNLEFSVTIEDIENKIDQQGFKCSISGIELIPGVNASLDRIDSNRGYTVNNIQWLDKNVNRMKSDFSQEDFLNICIRIAKNNG